MRAIFLDIETTGLDSTRHCPIDIAFKVIDITQGTTIGVYQNLIKPTSEAWNRRDPSSMKINGFTWEEISQGNDSNTVGLEIITLLQSFSISRGSAVFICQNPAFDRGFFSQLIDVYTQERLNWPYHWLDLASMYWVVFLQRKMKEGVPLPESMNLSKNEIAREFSLPSEVEPHRAMNGVEHLIQCYQAVMGVKFKETI